MLAKKIKTSIIGNCILFFFLTLSNLSHVRKRRFKKNFRHLFLKKKLECLTIEISRLNKDSFQVIINLFIKTLQS